MAKSLAAEVISEAAFTPIGDQGFRLAAEQMADCAKVLCPLSAFGPMNEKNRLLRELAEQAGKLL